MIRCGDREAVGWQSDGTRTAIGWHSDGTQVAIRESSESNQIALAWASRDCEREPPEKEPEEEEGCGRGGAARGGRDAALLRAKNCNVHSLRSSALLTCSGVAIERGQWSSDATISSHRQSSAVISNQESSHLTCSGPIERKSTMRSRARERATLYFRWASLPRVATVERSPGTAVSERRMRSLSSPGEG